MPKQGKVNLNPIGINFLFMGLKMAAKLMIQTGLLDGLDKIADKTETEIDNMAVKGLKAFLKVMAGE